MTSSRGSWPPPRRDEYNDEEDIDETDEPPQKEKPQFRKSGTSLSERKGPTIAGRISAEVRRICGLIFGSSDRIRINEKWDRPRKAFARILNLHMFECFMGSVILFNIVLIMIETDRRLQCEDPDSLDCSANAPDIKIPDQICLCLYTVELAMRLFVYQCSFLSVRWNVFDFGIVVISILGEFVGSVFKDAVIIRAIRVLRLVRMLRLLTIFQELYLMMASMASTLRTIFWAVVMLVAVLSVCSLIAVEILRPTVKDLYLEGKLEGCPRCVVAFDSVTASMVTFFQVLIMGEGVDDLMVPLIEQDWMAAVFILVIVAVVYLGFSNLILSVIVDKANEARTGDAFYQAMMHKKSRSEARRVLVEFWKKADMDMSNTITLEELRTTYETQDTFRSYFRQMDIDLPFLEMAFESMDNGNGECSFEELADSVVQMKNTDLGPVVSLLKFQMSQVLREMNNLSTQMNSLQTDLNDSAEMTKHKLHKQETMFHRSMSRNAFNYASPAANEDHAHNDAGGATLLSTAMADMMCWSNSPRDDQVVKRLSGSTMDEHEREVSGELHIDDNNDYTRRGAGKEMKSFTDSKETTARWSRDYRGGWEDDRSGRGRSRQRATESEGVMAAASGGKELAALQSQAQEIERDIRNLKSKLASDTGSKRSERREDVKILTEILADIRGQESQKKREISAAMGTARHVRADRAERKAEENRRRIKREMEWTS